jgi:hypothetical protein
LISDAQSSTCLEVNDANELLTKSLSHLANQITKSSIPAISDIVLIAILISDSDTFHQISKSHKVLPIVLAHNIKLSQASVINFHCLQTISLALLSLSIVDNLLTLLHNFSSIHNNKSSALPSYFVSLSQ